MTGSDVEVEEDTPNVTDVALAYLAKHKWLIIAQGKTLYAVHTEDSKLVHAIETDDVLRGIAVCPDNDHFIFAGDGKTLSLFSVAKGVVAKLEPPHTKKISAVICTSDGKRAFYADKVGEVMSVDVPGLQGKKFELGHLSQITCMAFTPGDRYILTGDRDEKIRVSHHPRTDVIEEFCLGHTEFVSAISPFKLPAGTEDVEGGCGVVSGSGDGTLRVWKLPQAQCTFVHQLAQQPEGEGAAAGDEESGKARLRSSVEGGSGKGVVVFVTTFSIGERVFVVSASDVGSGAQLFEVDQALGLKEAGKLATNAAGVLQAVGIPSGPNGVNVWLVCNKLPYVRSFSVQLDQNNTPAIKENSLEGLDQSGITLKFDTSRVAELASKRQKKEKINQERSQRAEAQA